MAKRTASAQKQARKSAKRRLLNSERKLKLKEALKDLKAAKKEDAQKQLPKVQALIDKSVRWHLVHRKAASRLKSRISREVAEAE